MVSIQACQAWDGGSIPLTCSIRKYARTFRAFLFIKIDKVTKHLSLNNEMGEDDEEFYNVKKDKEKDDFERQSHIIFLKSFSLNCSNQFFLIAFSNTNNSIFFNSIYTRCKISCCHRVIIMISTKIPVV